MAKKVNAVVKLQIPAGKATPAPPVGTALGPQGVNIMEFCKAFNAKTSGQGPGRSDHPRGDYDLQRPVLYIHHQDAASSDSGEEVPESSQGQRGAEQERRSARSRMDQVDEIAKIKMPDLNSFDIESAKAQVTRRLPQHGRRSHQVGGSTTGENGFVHLKPAAFCSGSSKVLI